MLNRHMVNGDGHTALGSPALSPGQTTPGCSSTLQVGSTVRAEVTVERVSGNRVAFDTVCRLATQPPTPLLDSQVATLGTRPVM
jgi:hypothetical protein